MTSFNDFIRVNGIFEFFFVFNQSWCSLTFTVIHTRICMHEWICQQVGFKNISIGEGDL